MNYFTLTVQIESDSGNGPYKEIKYIANCFLDFPFDLIPGHWTVNRSTITVRGKQKPIYGQEPIKVIDFFDTGMADCKVTILNAEEQPDYYVLT